MTLEELDIELGAHVLSEYTNDCLCGGEGSLMSLMARRAVGEMGPLIPRRLRSDALRAVIHAAGLDTLAQGNLLSQYTYLQYCDWEELREYVIPAAIVCFYELYSRGETL